MKTKRKSKWLDDAAVLKEGRKYSGRWDFRKSNQPAYTAALKRGLLDQLYPSKYVNWSDDEAILKEGRKYSSRGEFYKGSSSAYQAANKRGLLDQLYPPLVTDWSSDESVLKEGRNYKSRSEFSKNNISAYQAANKRNLLDQLYSSLLTDWSEEALLAEGVKYKSRYEFKKGNGRAYEAARRRDLLDLIDFPENNARSDNNAIYIWAALGQTYNREQVYKIGVTSARLGTQRIESVATSYDVEFEILVCTEVNCKATDLEKQLLVLGDNPGFTGFDGSTEMRSMNKSQLDAATKLISLHAVSHGESNE